MGRQKSVNAWAKENQFALHFIYLRGPLWNYVSIEKNYYQRDWWHSFLCCLCGFQSNIITRKNQLRNCLIQFLKGKKSLQNYSFYFFLPLSNYTVLKKVVDFTQIWIVLRGKINKYIKGFQPAKQKSQKDFRVREFNWIGFLWVLTLHFLFWLCFPAFHIWKSTLSVVSRSPLTS